MSERYVDSVMINHQQWHVYATVEADGSVSFIRMTYGVGERYFPYAAPRDKTTTVGQRVVDANLKMGPLEYSRAADDSLFEDFD